MGQSRVAAWRAVREPVSSARRVGARHDVVLGRGDAGLLVQALHALALVAQHEGHDAAGGSGARGAAGAVQVGLGVLGRVDVHDERDVVDVDAAGGDVGGDEDVDLALLELRHRARAGVLRHAAVQAAGVDAAIGDVAGDALGAELRADEHDRAAVATGDLGGDHGLVLAVHDEHVVLHRVDRRRRRLELVADRVVHVVADQGVDVAVEGGREEERLRGGRAELEQRGDLGQEAHVGHLVRLVEDDDLDVVEEADALTDQVGETARRGDEHVDAALQRVLLLVHRRAADDRLEVQAERAAKRLERVVDLHRELAGRHEDQAARVLGLRGVVRDAGEHRQAEGERLAGAGAAATEEVVAGEGVGDRLDLDRERRGDAGAGERRDERGRQPEVAERDGVPGVVGGVRGGVGDVERRVIEQSGHRNSLNH